MVRNLILSGGVAHDYATTSPMVGEVLSDVGIRSEIREDFNLVEDGSILGFDLLTLNCVRWTCDQTPKWRGRWGFRLPEAASSGLLGFLEQGKGLLALHAATICFDDWPEYRRILGAWWEWGTSGHAPLQKHRVRVCTGTHPIVKGIEDFDIIDELYTDARITDRVDPLIEGDWQGKRHPILWVRDCGNARVCYNALGHGPEAFGHPSNRLLIQRGALWVCRKLH